MKISSKCAIAALALVGAATVVSAGSVTFTSGVRPINFNGGEFVGTYDGGVLGGRSFGGFCLEIEETIVLDNPNATYGYEVVSPGDGAIGGNVNFGPPSSTGGDSLSNQAAWIFVQWATNRASLAGLMGNASLSAEEVARRVQRAIWNLEDEQSVPSGTQGTHIANLIAAAENAVDGAAMTDLTRHSAFDVNLFPEFSKLRIVNPFDTNANGDRLTERQSQIILIPLPTASGMALAGLALVGGIRRRK
jgi:hypothetical protein